MGPRQVARHVLPDGPGGGHPRRVRRPQRPGHQLHGQRRGGPGGPDVTDAVQRQPDRGPLRGSLHPRTRRCHRHRHARRGGRLPRPAALPGRRRRRAGPHRGHRRPGQHLPHRTPLEPGRMAVERVDVLVVGGGIVGLATAYQLLRRKPGLRLALIDREDTLAAHQSGHNSGVIHAGLYYAPGSLKARLCRQGKAELEAFAEAHGIPIGYPGKLVVALSEDELPRLADIKIRATANEVEGLEESGPERIRELEPEAAGIRALWSPRTGIIDYRAVALAYAADLRSRGVAIHT